MLPRGVVMKAAMAQRLFFTVGLLLLAGTTAQAQYLGKRIGSLSRLQHDVSGEVYAVDSRTLHIKGFTYDGTAPDAYFYAGTHGLPSDEGFIIPDENGSNKPLGHYNGKDVTLTLPEGVTLKDIKWISVWCKAFAIDFGNLIIPNNLQYPRPQKIDALSTLEHDVSSDRIVVVDAQTFLIPNFNYDGTAPDAHFWVGKGSRPGAEGVVVPDENGATEPLKKYSSKTIVITLPDHLTVFDIDFLSVWCKAFFSDFGNVRIPANLNVPPSLKMLGVAPQTKLNCEVLYDGLALEVRWAVAGDSIVMQLVGRVADGEYMSFGLSGSDTNSVMVGGDVVTAWLERNTGKGFAQDYYLGAKAQCQGGGGSCPDVESSARNDVRLLNAALINDFTMLTFQRPLAGLDPTQDKTIFTDRSQPVIWAVGPVNSQGHTSFHKLRNRGDMFIDFGRSPKWNCPLPDEQPTNSPAQPARQPASNQPRAVTPSPNAWFIPPIPCYEPEDGVFYAQIGPTGGDNGYNAITGHVGWGIAFYINGLLIPEINVVRGKTYTFVVEGGHDPANPSKSHPLYITDDPEGGYAHKTEDQRNAVTVYAGVEYDQAGNPTASAYGRLCEWKQDPNQPASGFTSFGAYQRSLNLKCDEGQPGILQWTPDANTPDTVYYQCFTHRFLGWKIRVHDSCDGTNQQLTQPDYNDYYYDETDGLTAQGSNTVNRLVTPPDNKEYFESQREVPNSDGLPSKHTPTISSRNGLGLDNRNKETDFTVGFDSFPFKVTKGDTGGNLNRGASSWSNRKEGNVQTLVATEILDPGLKFFKSTPSSFQDINENFHAEIQNSINAVKPTTRGEYLLTKDYSYVNGDSEIGDGGQGNRQQYIQNHKMDDELTFSDIIRSNNRKKYNSITRELNTPVPVRLNVKPVNTRQTTQTFQIDSPISFRRNPASQSNAVGFNPKTVIFESDFVPILTEDSPGPPRHLLKSNERNIDNVRFQEHKPPSTGFVSSHMKTIDDVNFNKVIDPIPENVASSIRSDNILSNKKPSVIHQSSVLPQFTLNKPFQFPGRGIQVREQIPHNIILSNERQVGLPDFPSLPGLDTHIPQHGDVMKGRIKVLPGEEIILDSPKSKQIYIPQGVPGAGIQLSGNLRSSIDRQFNAAPGRGQIFDEMVSHSVPNILRMRNDHFVNEPFSTHFKSPADPPTSFKVHQILSGSQQQAGPHGISGVPPQHLQHGGVPLNRPPRNQRRPFRRRPGPPGRNPNQNLRAQNQLRGRPLPPNRIRNINALDHNAESESGGNESFLQSIWSTFMGRSLRPTESDKADLKPKPRNL